MTRPASKSDLRSVSWASVPNPAQQESSSSEFFACQPVTPSVTLAASDLPAYVLEVTLDREINLRLSNSTFTKLTDILTAVPTLGNLLGNSSVWIAFIFISDDSVTYPEGAYVDNIVLRKRTGSMADEPTRSLSCDVVRQADYVLDPCAPLTVGLPPKTSK